MKKYITLVLLLVGFTNCFSQNPTIAWPKNYSVFQRNGNAITSTATVTFAGQAYSKNAKYQIDKLDQFGNFKSTYKSKSLISGISGVVTQNVGTNAMMFHFSLTIPTGWYRLTITSDIIGTIGMIGTYSPTTSIKFGVGEVFVIAGQSNAAGYGGSQKIGTELNYDCVVSCKNTFLPSYSSIENPVMGTIHSDGKIAPQGDRPWFYQELGNKIASSSATPSSASLTNVVPVAFFNTAVVASSINQWKTSLDRTRSLYNNSYANPLTAVSTSVEHFHPWGRGGDNRGPYMAFQFTISYYANMFGVRSVLWHQGESETKMELSKNNPNKYNFVKSISTVCPFNSLASLFNQDTTFYSTYSLTKYKTKLDSIINDSRTILPNLPWAISKVSLTSEYKYALDANGNPTIFIEPITSCYRQQTQIQNITNATVVAQQGLVYNPTKRVYWASQNSDTYTAPINRSDGTHFNAVGLAKMATDYYSNIPTILTAPPITPRPISRLSFTKSGSTYTVTCNNTNSPVYFQWTPGQTPYIDVFQTNVTNTVSSTKIYTSSPNIRWASCYTKDNSGRISISSVLNYGGVSGARMAATDSSAISSVIYPNPTPSEQDVHLKITINEPTSLEIFFRDENGNEIDRLEEEVTATGEFEYQFKLPVFNKESKVIFVTILKNGQTETKRLLINK